MVQQIHVSNVQGDRRNETKREEGTRKEGKEEGGTKNGGGEEGAANFRQATRTEDAMMRCTRHASATTLLLPEQSAQGKAGGKVRKKEGKKKEENIAFPRTAYL